MQSIIDAKCQSRYMLPHLYETRPHSLVLGCQKQTFSAFVGNVFSDAFVGSLACFLGGVQKYIKAENNCQRRLNKKPEKNTSWIAPTSGSYDLSNGT